MAEPQVQRDTEYYFAFRTFKVGDAVFRVPRHLFLMPNAKIEPVPKSDGTGDDLVQLGDEIKKDDFLQLLRAVYPREYNNPETLSQNQWQAVLRLSKIFGMDDVSQKAARNLKDIFFAGDPVDGLICAKENKLDDWIAPLINKIVQKKKELTEEELEKVGVPLAMKIAWALGKAGAPMGELAGSDSASPPPSASSPGGKKGKVFDIEPWLRLALAEIQSITSPSGPSRSVKPSRHSMFLTALKKYASGRGHIVPRAEAPFPQLPNASVQPVPLGTDNEGDMVVFGNDIKKDEFLQFLRAVYPRHYNTPEVLTTDQWQAVFRLSQTFGMNDLRTRAANELKEVFFSGDPVEGLLCAKDNGLEDWIFPLIDKLIEADRDPTDGEWENLGPVLGRRIAGAQGAAGSNRV
ncbi:hypothetical protein NP233_g9701 [Leucocoprinus birnbaumii]|uniref:BTB domain-containing protein n=1 Tax=Leucocoprinus birnbaumii TaxID=56174 RepID=A0AAD5YSL3_9AGAR|nr:hypothetical protein NP233_g9701 [Leucocoprinus birnbaumii]